MELPTLDIAPGLRASPTTVDDASALSRLVRKNRQHLQTYLPAVTALASEHEADAHLQRLADAVAKGELLEWHLFADDVLCGAVRLNQIEEENRKLSVAYYIDAAHQGRGIVTRAVRSVLHYVFNVMKFNRVELRCVTDNLPSVRVAERLGFAREGLLRQAERLDGAFVDHYVYGLLREDFLQA